MARSKLPKCGQCSSRTCGLVYREGDYWCEKCTAALIAKLRKERSLYLDHAGESQRAARQLEAKLRAQPKGKVLARGWIDPSDVAAGTELTVWAFRDDLRGQCERPQFVKVVEVVKGGGE